MSKVFSWEPDYCQYDVCKCSHYYCEHGKKDKCYNSGSLDVEKEIVIPCDTCTCKKFNFKHAEIMRKPK